MALEGYSINALKSLAARAFFKKAIKQHGRPLKVSLDKSGSNKAGLDWVNMPLLKEEKKEMIDSSNYRYKPRIEWVRSSLQLCRRAGLIWDQ